MTPEPLLETMEIPIRCLLGREKAFRLYESIQRFRGYPALRALYKEKVGSDLNLADPLTFNEKINWLKLYDRNPVLPILADKVRVRDWIADRIGSEVLVPLVGVYSSARCLQKGKLPPRYVAKINHSSALNVIVWDMEAIDWNATIDQLDRWLRQPQPYKLMEWYHHCIPPRIIVEQLLVDEDGTVPSDYKFYVFHGKVELIYRYSGRFGKRTLTFYRPDWEFLPDISGGEDVQAAPKPLHLGRMIGISEQLGAEFPFLRVDFYCPGDELYIGELTPHPYSGLCTMYPREFDIELGRHLDLGKCGWR